MLWDAPHLNMNGRREARPEGQEECRVIERAPSTPPRFQIPFTTPKRRILQSGEFVPSKRPYITCHPSLQPHFPLMANFKNPLPVLCLGDESYPRRHPDGREGQKLLKYKTPSPLPILILQLRSHNTPVNPLTEAASSQNITNTTIPACRHLRPRQS